MHNVLVIGAGKIGTLIAFLLAHTNDYSVYLTDIQPEIPELNLFNKLPHFCYSQLDASKTDQVSAFVKKNKIDVVVSSLPYFGNLAIAKIAAEHQLHYFDLTEDVKTTEAVDTLAKNSKTAFVPQCGLAPGFISIVANDLMKHFQKLDSVKLRVGALPLNTNNALQYSLTWSTDGLINEYGNPCEAVVNGKQVTLQALDDLEKFELNGLTYEAFNTSGGIGSLVKTYEGKINDLNYKTIRYPGHCEKIRFLMNDLKLNEDRQTLKRIFERTISRTLQDVVVVYVSVTGIQNKQFIEENYAKKFYSKNQHGHHWSAIQLTTASGLCSVLDMVLANPKKYHGVVRQEDFSLAELTENRFGHYFIED